MRHRAWLAAGAALTVATMGLAGSAAAEPAEGTIRAGGAGQVIPDSYLVVLKERTGLRISAASQAEDLVRRHGGRTGRTFGKALQGFSVTASEAVAKRLAADPAVAFVQPNARWRISEVQPDPTWGLDRVDQRSGPTDNRYGFTGTASGVHAYIVDTGIRTSHESFGGRASSGFDAIDGGAADDCNGHGTHVAGTVGGSDFGVAKDVDLVAVRVLDCDGFGTTEQVVAGLDWVVENAVRPAVANMSLGGPADPVLDEAVQNAIDSGITFVVAAGNGDDRGRALNACGDSPAGLADAITVSATDFTDAKPTFANFGSCVDIFAPGVEIASASAEGDTGSLSLTGTSMAAPHVAGAAALILAGHPDFSPEQVRDELVATATPNAVTSAGNGSPRGLLFLDPGELPAVPAPTAGCAGEHRADQPIPDLGTTTSTITISGCGRAAQVDAAVEVHIRHTFRGDLQLDLIAPDGTAFRLKSASGRDTAPDVDVVFGVNLSGESADGVWQLRMQDAAQFDSGYLDLWSLDL